MTKGELEKRRSVNESIYQFRSDIQGLRAISVIAVILFHMGVPGFEGGFLGVDIFFAISGFLMASIISRDVEQGMFSYRSFYIRRLRRIFPAVFATLLFSLVASWFILFPKNFEDFTDVMGASVLFLANAVLMNQSSGYFAETLENHPLLHMWSLAVEEQFYLLFPFLFLLSLRFGIVIAFCVSFGLFIGSLWLAEYYYEISPSATFFHLPARFFEFYVGVLAFLVVRYFDGVRHILRGAGGIGILLIVISIFVFDSGTPFPSLWSLIPLMGVFLILISKNGDIASQMLSAGPLVWIGGLSFSLYLLHQPVFAILRYQEFSGMFVLGTALLIIVLGAWLMKRLIEDPARYIWSARKLSIWLLFTGSFMVSVTLITKDQDGIPSRFEGELMQAVSTAIGSPLRQKCHTDGDDYLRPENACRYFEGELKWAVLGDSHGVPIAYALAELVRDRGQSVAHLTFSGCGLNKPKESACRRWLSDAEKYILGTDSIESVVLSFRLLAQLYGRHEFIYPEIPKDKADKEIESILSIYVDLIDRLQASGKQVIWIMQPPEVGNSMVSLLSSINQNKTDAISVPLSWWVERSGVVPETMKKLLPDRTIVVWPEDVLCNFEINSCYAIKNSVAFYRDRDHLSLEGAKIVLNYLLSKLDAKDG